MMGRWKTAATLALALALPVSVEAGPRLNARAGVVMDAETGEVIWERNARQALPPASTTKILTAILAIESGRLDENFRVSSRAASTPPSRINLRSGQQMKLRNLLYALLLKSANDAAAVVAEGLAGSQTAFGRQMTARAREIGAGTAQFKNPHGLTAAGHVASARDLATIFRHALGLPLMRSMLGTRSIRVPIESPKVKWISLYSHNRLLTGHTYKVIGKTGFTRAAKRCFVGSASHGGREVIIVVLGSNDLWGDAKRLFAHGFGITPERPQVRQASGGGSRGAGGYSVELGPYASRAQASSTRSKLKRHGYTAVLSGRAVRVGRFASRSRAERLAGRLRRHHGVRGGVVALGGGGRVPTVAARTSGTRYTVRLGPYEGRGAVTTHKTLERKGYSALRDGQTVRVGRFSSRTRAQRLADRLRRNDRLHGAVVALDASGRPAVVATATAAQQAPPVGSRYAVQLGPYESRAAAVETRAKLKRKGYTAELDGRAVRLGKFASRTRARRLAERLARNDGLSGAVVALGARGRVTVVTAARPPRAAVASAAASSESAPSRYAVQLGPYESRGAAVATRSKLKRKGYTAEIAGTAVRLGQFASRARAQGLADRLRRNDGYQGVVVPVGSPVDDAPNVALTEPAAETAEGDDDRPARWAVRLGPYQSAATATAEHRRLARRGYTAVLEGSQVRLGLFADRTRAEGLAERLRRNDGLEGTVVQAN